MGTMHLRSAGKSWRLSELAPAWLGGRGRKQVGMSFRCPAHLTEPHRLCIWFENPGDGGPPVGAPRHCWREGDALDHLTVLGPDDERALAFPGHWRGWVVEGEVHSSRFVPGEADPAADYGAPVREITRKR